VFTLSDRGSDQRYVVPAKSADDDENFHRELVIHDDGEYMMETRA
jgi:hypothetical protein